MKSTTTQIDAEQAAKEDQLVREHLPLVQYVVSEVAHRVPNHVSRSDLVSAGMLGLAQAARSFDPERGIAFDRFASTRIRGALLDELRGRDWASRSVRSRARGLQATQEELTNRLGRAPKPEEVALALGIAPETVHKLVDDVHRATVLNYDSLVVEGDAESFIASPDDGPEDTLLDRERKAYLMDAVGALPERLRRVVIGYFFEERSMQDLADELGVSESRISQLRGGVAVASRRRQLPTRARRPSGRAASERARRASQGELLRRRRRRLRLPHAFVGPTDRGRRDRRAHCTSRRRRRVSSRANERARMHISTLNQHNDLDNTGANVPVAQTAAREPSEVQAALQSAIANLKVSSENVTASDSHVTDTEMSPELFTFTRSQILRQAGPAMLADADAVPQTVLDLLQ